MNCSGVSHSCIVNSDRLLALVTGTSTKASQPPSKSPQPRHLSAGHPRLDSRG